jgi:hypothetical protein
MASPMPMGLDSSWMWYYITALTEIAVGKMPDPLPKTDFLKGSPLAKTLGGAS